MRTVIKIDKYSVIENKIKALKKKLTEARKLGKKRKIKEIKDEINKLNEKLDNT